MVPRPLTLSKDAEDLLWEFYLRVERSQAPDGPFEGIRPIASKAAEQAARIGAVLTLWSDREATVVTSRTMEDAVSLASYYLNEALRLVENSAVETGMAQADRIRRWILGNCPSGYVKPRDIENKGPGGLRAAKTVKAALRILVEYGWLQAIPPGTLIDGKLAREAYLVLKG